jgi:hemerythrin
MPNSWSNDLLTGVQIIDSQHREFFARVDGLIAQCMVVGDAAAYPQAFEFLRTYVDEHFGTEEELMHRYDYAQTPFHEGQHHWFKTELGRIHDEVLEGGLSASVRTRFSYLLVDWFRGHIRGVDLKLAAFLKGKSVCLSQVAG